MKEETPEQVTKWFQIAVQKLGPAVAGSLSLRKGPCIRKNCRACARGEGHASYALYGRLKGKPFSIYVPNDLVPELSAAIANGQSVQELLSERCPIRPSLEGEPQAGERRMMNQQSARMNSC